MGSIKRRLEQLEAQAAGANSEWVIPMEARIHCKAINRYRAREEGEEPLPYTQEEIEHMRESDLETVSGGGVGAMLRNNPGWQTAETQEILDAWVEGARMRLDVAEDLPPERWCEVWGVDDGARVIPM